MRVELGFEVEGIHKLIFALKISPTQFQKLINLKC